MTNKIVNIINNSQINSINYIIITRFYILIIYQKYNKLFWNK